MTISKTLCAAALASIITSPLTTGSSNAAGAFANFTGSWSGTGQMRLEGGRISLRCASSASKVELRANLTSNGNRVSGEWEERQFNVGGRASGSANGNNISLAINGGGLNGSMSVTTNGSRQSVSITTENAALKGIQIGLARD
jgi:hypothetical protein